MRHLLVLLLTVPHLCAVAQSRSQLQVTGVGHFESPPDVAILNIELKTIQKEFPDAVSAIESDYQQMVKHLVIQGFSKDEIKTSDYGIRTNWVYRQEQSYDSGFVGSHNLTVELANTRENLAKTIQSFSKSPVKARLHITFTVSDSLRETIQDAIIKKAIEDARQKAKLMAEASGLQLGKIVKVTYGTGSSGPQYFTEMYDIQATMQPPPDEGTQEQVTYTVKELSFKDEVMIVYTLKGVDNRH